MKILLCIDVQKGFVNDSSKNIIHPIIESSKNPIFDCVIATKFVNSKKSVYYNSLNWKHLIDKSEIELVDGLFYTVCLNKYSYSACTASFSNILKKYNITKADEIYICGIDTDCCVMFTAVDLFQKGYNIYLYEDLCASTGGKEVHDAAIKILKRNIGKNRVIKYEKGIGC